MSVKIMSQVWPLPLTSTQKLVLLALADNCNDRGECYPSVSNICKKTGLSDRGVQKVISELEKMGFVSRSLRYGRSTLYTITPERGSPPNAVHPEPCSPDPERGSPPPPNDVHPTPERGSPITINEPSIEPSPKRQKSETQKSPRATKRFIKPSVDELTEYMKTIFADPKVAIVEADKFFNFYSANGWVVGMAKANMKDWKAACRNWRSNWDGIKQARASPTPSKHTGFNERDYSEGIRADGSF